MRFDLKPDPQVAADLIEGFNTLPIVHRGIHKMLSDYRDQCYGQMLSAPDDQLAGWRGMLLCLNNLQTALHPDSLRVSIEKAMRKN